MNSQESFTTRSSMRAIEALWCWWCLSTLGVYTCEGLRTSQGPQIHHISRINGANPVLVTDKAEALRPFVHLLQQRLQKDVTLLRPDELSAEQEGSSIFISRGHLSPERQRCKYDALVPEDPSSFASSLDSLANLWYRLEGRPPTAESTELDVGEWSHFVSLSYVDVAPHVHELNAVCDGCDAVEVRADLFASTDSQFIHEQLALVRKHVDLPIIFTVRTCSQAGTFPDAESEARYAILNEGLRAGADWIDIEAGWDDQRTSRFIDIVKGYSHTRILGSYHATKGLTSFDLTPALIERCTLQGRADAAKLVTRARSFMDAVYLHTAASLSPVSDTMPLCCVCLGDEGRISRVMNRRFTPVTHPLLRKAAPGQMSVRDLMSVRVSGGILTPRKYYLFGHPISASPSPDMHNGAFVKCFLPHTYERHESSDVSVYEQLMNESTFGGASVTIPHKESIMQYLDEIVPPADEIGAVNTVEAYVDPQSLQRKLRGYNVDWLGILRPIEKRLRARILLPAQNVCLVLGAGGTARAASYVAKMLNLKLKVYNRTYDKAEIVARAFQGEALASLDEVRPEEVAVIISTIPAAAEFTVPPSLLEFKPVVLEAAYRPPLTALLRQAKDAQCAYIQGAEMLVEQGKEQFQLWHKRRAPHTVMSSAVFKTVEKV